MQGVDLFGQGLEFTVELVVLDLDGLDFPLEIFRLLLQLEDLVGADLEVRDLSLALMNACVLHFLDVLVIDELHLILHFLQALALLSQFSVFGVEIRLDFGQVLGEFVTLSLESFKLFRVGVILLDEAFVLGGQVRHFLVAVLKPFDQLCGRFLFH